MWDPASYLRYGDERSRPFYELLGRVAARRPRTVVDLGCGPGNLTVTLAARWPAARVVGLDSSAEMIAAATRTHRTDPPATNTPPGGQLDAPPGGPSGGQVDASSGAPPGGLSDAEPGGPSGGRVNASPGAPPGGRVEFGLADARTWSPDPEVDVLVANAVLQWIPGHQELLLRWVRELGSGRWLAVQVPGNFSAASHRALREVAGDPRWPHLADLLRADPVSDAAGYATLLTGAGCAVDAWETTYVHQLPASGATDHPVLSWMEGTALRPVRAALGGAGAAWDDFRVALTERLVEAYPVRHGLVQFPFRRVFFVARTGARSQ